MFNNVNSKTIGRTFTQIKAPVTQDKPARFQVVYYASNGSWYQDISTSRSNGSFKVTTKVYPGVKDSDSPSLDEEYIVEYVSIKGQPNISIKNRG